jgi:hypothetical protein
MTQVAEMLRTHPADLVGLDRQALGRCIDACSDCTQTCTACADACLSEDAVIELVTCVRINLDCADMCDTTGRVLSRHTGYDADVARAVLMACAETCRACAEECGMHAGMYEHCRVCAEACRRCEQACRELMSSMA